MSNSRVSFIYGFPLTNAEKEKFSKEKALQTHNLIHVLPRYNDTDIVGKNYEMDWFIGMEFSSLNDFTEKVRYIQEKKFNFNHKKPAEFIEKFMKSLYPEKGSLMKEYALLKDVICSHKSPGFIMFGYFAEINYFEGICKNSNDGEEEYIESIDWGFEDDSIAINNNPTVVEETRDTCKVQIVNGWNGHKMCFLDSHGYFVGNVLAKIPAIDYSTDGETSRELYEVLSKEYDVSDIVLPPITKIQQRLDEMYNRGVVLVGEFPVSTILFTNCTCCT